MRCHGPEEHLPREEAHLPLLESPSADSRGGSLPHRWAFVFKHGVLSTLFLVLLSLASWACGAFKSKFHTSEFFGHLGPGGFLFGIGAFEFSAGTRYHVALCLTQGTGPLRAAIPVCFRSDLEIQKSEAVAGMIGSFAYVAMSAVHRGQNWSRPDLDFLHYSYR